jgi:hypothetical protein
VKRLFVAALLAAFSAAVVLPTTAIVGSDGAYAAGKITKKKPAKKYKKPKKKRAPTLTM